MQLKRSWFAVAGAVALVGAAACSSSSGPTVHVTSTKTACTPEKTDLAPGKVTFEVRNDGDDETEMYVQTAAGKTIGEVENIGPATSRTLGVTLKPGAYKVVCKPGQKGDGIATPVMVS